MSQEIHAGVFRLYNLWEKKCCYTAGEAPAMRLLIPLMERYHNASKETEISSMLKRGIS